MQRRQRLALVAEQPVWVVLEDQQLALVCDLDEASPARERHRHAARVLKVRDRVDELRAAALALERVEQILQLIDAHAARTAHGVQGHAQRMGGRS